MLSRYKRIRMLIVFSKISRGTFVRLPFNSSMFEDDPACLPPQRGRQANHPYHLHPRGQAGARAQASSHNSEP